MALEFGQHVGWIKTEVPGPKSRDFAKRLRKVETPGITFIAEDFPVFWERALGSNVEDADGNIYVDFTAAFGVTALGHAHPAITKAILEQASKLPHGMGDVHPPSIKVDLLERLSALFPGGNGQTILCSSGAEAVEAALKTARLCSGRPGILAFENGYHGLTYGTMAVSGQRRFKEPFADQIASIVQFVPFPTKDGESNLVLIENLLRSSPIPIGAVLVEPIQGRGGVLVPPKGWLKKLSAVAHKFGALLITDEIFTGFGRTGEWFAVNHDEVIPDLLCAGKALTGALPFSACIGTKDVMRAWPDSDGDALHTSTFLGHPLGCAAALVSLNEIERLGLCARAGALGQKMMTEITSWEGSLNVVHQVRGRGLMIGIELKRGSETGLAFTVARKSLQKGLIVLSSGPTGNVISLSPPLTISEEQVDWSLETLKTILGTLP